MNTSTAEPVVDFLSEFARAVAKGVTAIEGPSMNIAKRMLIEFIETVAREAVCMLDKMGDEAVKSPHYLSADQLKAAESLTEQPVNSRHYEKEDGTPKWISHRGGEELVEDGNVPFELPIEPTYAFLIVREYEDGQRKFQHIQCSEDEDCGWDASSDADTMLAPPSEDRQGRYVFRAFEIQAVKLTGRVLPDYSHKLSEKPSEQDDKPEDDDVDPPSHIAEQAHEDLVAAGAVAAPSVDAAMEGGGP